MQTVSRRCFIGFDGFTDTIVRAVRKRSSVEAFSEFKNLNEFSHLISGFQDKSGNIELVPQQVKIGGNGPIFANALGKAGHKVTYAGLIGEETVEPLFQSMQEHCHELLPLGQSGRTVALEFPDGKLMLGIHDSLHTFSIESLDLHVIQKQIQGADFIGSMNWTMLFEMQKIWEWMSELPINHNPWLFIDLADPMKRSQADLRLALETLTKLEQKYRVILGLNSSEQIQVASCLNVSADPTSIRQKLQISQVVVHETKRALASSDQEEVEIDGPYTPNPKISTGAGDHFNAGYAHALLCEGSLKQAVQCGVLWSGFYVRSAFSPTVDEVQAWSIREAPELGKALFPFDQLQAPPL